MIDDSLRRRYLLGEGTDEECAALEQAFMRDLEEQERIAAVEELLIEDHIDGTLDEHQRQRFESHYLATPEHRERVHTTRRLLAAATASSFAAQTEKPAGSGRPASSTPLRWFAAAAVLLMVAGRWIIGILNMR